MVRHQRRQLSKMPHDITANQKCAQKLADGILCFRFFFVWHSINNQSQLQSFSINTAVIMKPRIFNSHAEIVKYCIHFTCVCRFRFLKSQLSIWYYGTFSACRNYEQKKINQLLANITFYPTKLPVLRVFFSLSTLSFENVSFFSLRFIHRAGQFDVVWLPNKINYKMRTPNSF